MQKLIFDLVLSSFLKVRTVDILKMMIKFGEKPTSSTDWLDNDLVDIICTEFNAVPSRIIRQNEVSNNKETNCDVS
jgi:hypothetical protein